MNDRDTPARLARYLECLREATGVDPVIQEVSPRDQAAGQVLAIAYMDVPERGHLTGFTYGLSLSNHPDWMLSRRELTITVRSDDYSWASVPAKAVGALRGIAGFNPGKVIGYMARFVEGSGMSSLLLAEPARNWGAGSFDLAPDGSELEENDLVEFVGAYPVHISEREFIQEEGFDAFWRLKWDRYDPSRLPAV